VHFSKREWEGVGTAGKTNSRGREGTEKKGEYIEKVGGPPKGPWQSEIHNAFLMEGQKGRGKGKNRKRTWELRERKFSKKKRGDAFQGPKGEWLPTYSFCAAPAEGMTARGERNQ